MSREVKTGIVAIVIIGLLIWGYNFLKGQDLFNGNSRHYFVEYQSIQGLTKASLVTINGLKVGKVDNIEFNQKPNKRGGLLVKFIVDNDFQFSKNSVVKIYSPSPLGGSNLAIIPNYEGQNAITNDTLKGVVESSLFTSIGERLDPLQTKLDQVLTQADSLLVGFNKVLDKGARKSLNRSVKGLEYTLSDVRKTLSGVNSILESNKSNLDATLTNAKQITDDFSKLSDNLSKVDINKTIKEFETTLADVNGLLKNIESGKGTLGKLMSDDKLYVNLEKASKEMEELLREMKLNPKRFVHFSLFGKKAKPYNQENNQQNKSNK